MVRYGTIWYGMVRYTVSMVWYGMVWYGMVWYGMVWYGRPEPQDREQGDQDDQGESLQCTGQRLVWHTLASSSLLLHRLPPLCPLLLLLLPSPPQDTEQAPQVLHSVHLHPCT